MDQEEGQSSAGGNSDEDKRKPEDWEFVNKPPECQNCPEICPTCQSSLIPSTTVFYYGCVYHGAPKDYVPINPQKEENKVSSTENQNQAAETTKNSLWCPECKVNFVTVNEVEEGLWRFVNMGMEAFGQLQNMATSILTYLRSIFPQSNQTQDVPIVKVYSFITGETFGAYEALMEKVKNKIPATLVQQENPKDADAFLVICPITSRVGSDVESAMVIQEVSSLDKPVILVLMHHTRDTDYSTEGTKWSEVHRNVKLDVHVLFHETIPGLLNCQQNNQAIEAIEKKLYEYRTFSPSHLNKSSHTPYQHV